MEAAVLSEKKMLSDYSFSISIGNIIESSHTNSFSSSSSQSSFAGSETNAYEIFNHANPEASNKIRRKGRKRNNGETQTVKTTNLMDDGYGWRKYGQKNILKELHPKSYYRCTNHKDEKCQAKKWIQQESENPPIYKTTYFGKHTCKNPHKIPQFFFSDYPSSSVTPSTPVFIHFDSPPPSHALNHEQMVKSRDEGLNSSSPPSIPSPSWSDDSMMLLDDHLFHRYSQQIMSPDCSSESYDFDMMIQELLAQDQVDFMQVYG